MRSACCLLHNLIAGGSARQWVHLLGRHVERGGRATICAPPGPLAEPARAAGIEVVPTSWDKDEVAARSEVWSAIERSDVAIVHWDHGVMDAFVPALELCGRAALAIHQAPHALARWFGPEILPSTRIPIEAALASDHAVALVRGESHRQRFEEAFDIPAVQLRVLPASIPLDRAFRSASAKPVEVLALVRFSPEKEPVARLAVELVRARQEMGQACRLTIAGDGPLRDELMTLSEERLPAGPWRVERPPRDPIARLAAADLVVAQGLTTLEAAALGRRVVVARGTEGNQASGVVLTPERYDEAARDPFGKPSLGDDLERIWAETLAISERDLHRLRRLVEKHNSLRTASRALGKALRKTR